MPQSKSTPSKSIFNHMYADHHKAWDQLDEIEKISDCKERGKSIVDLWNNELKEHFNEEETELFPNIKNSENERTIKEILLEHKTIISQIERVKSSIEEPTTSPILKNLISTVIESLKNHIHKEENLFRKYFPDPFKGEPDNEYVWEHIEDDLPEELKWKNAFSSGGHVNQSDINSLAYVMTLPEYQEKVAPVIKQYKSFIKKSAEYLRPVGTLRAITWNDIVAEETEEFYGEISPNEIRGSNSNWYKKLPEEEKKRMLEEHLEKKEYEWFHVTGKSPNKNDVPKDIMEKYLEFNSFFIKTFTEKIINDRWGIDADESKSNKRAVRRAIDDDTYKKLLEENLVTIEKLREVASSVGINLPKKVLRSMPSKQLSEEKLGLLFNQIPSNNKEKLIALINEVDKSFEKYAEDLFVRKKQKSLQSIEEVKVFPEISEKQFNIKMLYEGVYEKLGKAIRTNVKEFKNKDGRVVDKIRTDYYTVPPLSANWETALDRGIRNEIEEYKIPLFQSILSNFEKINMPISEIDNQPYVELGMKGFQGIFNFKFENGSSFGLETKAIEAGGYNIQVLHLRYITDFINVKLADGTKLTNPSLYNIVENFSNRMEMEKENDPYVAVNKAASTEDVIDSIFKYLKSNPDFSGVRKFTKSISYTNPQGKSRGIEFSRPPSGKELMDLDQAKAKAILYLENWGIEKKMSSGGQLSKGIEVEKEHKDLYEKLKKKLAQKGIEMPISEKEFYADIALRHLNEEKDYYDLLLKYVEKKALGGKLENSEKGSNFIKQKITKDEISNVIAGKSKVRNGDAIQAASSYLRGNARTSSSAKDKEQIKNEEGSCLREYAVGNNLWIPEVHFENFIGRGREHDVYFIDENTVVKTNYCIYYNSWTNYLNNLLLHNLFFPDTAYELIGFGKYNGYLASVVKQQFVKSPSETNLSDIKQFMLKAGFVNTEDDDYYNPDLCVVLQDLRDENVLTKDGVLYFIDTVFYLKKLKIEKKLAGGGKLETE